jgi:uncharacterized membrane protein
VIEAVIAEFLNANQWDIVLTLVGALISFVAAIFGFGGW